MMSRLRPPDSPAPPLLAADPAGGALVGVASTLPLSGRPVIEALARLRWRGNGRGGGVALAGCFPQLPDQYALNIALCAARLREQAHLRAEVERAFVTPYFDIFEAEFQPEAGDYRQLPGLAAEPPLVVRYFVRVKVPLLIDFAARNNLADLRQAEDEFVSRHAARLNRTYYPGPDEGRAFVLSHGRDMIVLKAIGCAEDVARYYRLETFRAHVWLGQQTYATCTHVGGSGPFAARDEALAFCGRIANYHALATFARQRGYRPRFRADGELAAMLFDFYTRVCGYPLELAMEAMLPDDPASTPPAALKSMPLSRQAVAALHHTHAHSAIEGPAFFAVARRLEGARAWQLVAALDSEAAHPNAFALQEGLLANGEWYGVGMVATERAALEGAFAIAASEQERLCPIPDRVWTAHRPLPDPARPIIADDAGAGAYSFTVRGEGRPYEPQGLTLACADKFGRVVATDRARTHRDGARQRGRDAVSLTAALGTEDAPQSDPDRAIIPALREGQVEAAYTAARTVLRDGSFAALGAWLDRVVALASTDPALRAPAIALLSALHDRRDDTGVKKRSAVLALLRRGLDVLFNAVPLETGEAPPAEAAPYADRRLTWAALAMRGAPLPPVADGTLYIDAVDLPLEGAESAARALVRAHEAGWRHVVVFGCKGDRLLAAGLGASAGLRVDIYGTAGDYLAAGLDGATVHVHGSAQDFAGHQMRGGALVVYGDVGQGLLHDATGGAVCVSGRVGPRALVGAASTLRVTLGGKEINLTR